MPAQPDIIVGIDLGTTFSLVAVCDESGPRVLTDERGEARFPSVVSIEDTDAGEPTLRVGWAARESAVEHPRSTIYSVKRLVGRSYADVADDLAYLAYRVVPGPRETVEVEIDGRRYSPEQISAIILTSLKRRAEEALGVEVRRAVITVPAYFDDAQRQATRNAAAAAGIEVVRIINEPTAAALAYGVGLRDLSAAAAGRAGGSISLPLQRCHEETAQPEKTSRKSETVAVYDLGGGTFDVSILRLEAGVSQVLSTAGDTHLGGDDLDRLITTLVTTEVSEQFGLSIDSPRTRQALRTLAEKVKIRLSDAASADVELDLGGGRVYRRTITRVEFESLAAPLVDRTIALVRRAIRDAGLIPGQIDEIVLVGGSTRVPLVRRKVAEAMERTPYTALNPEEVVALGASIQAAILGGAKLDMMLLDVTPLSLGIETMGGAFGKLILRNATIPCRAVERFTTFVDGQTAIKINVLQGERELARDCRSLGTFELRGIPPMPAGIPKVEVEFLIDANGILNVAAREERSGAQASIQIVPNRGLTHDEVDRIAREGIAHGREDIAAHRRVDLCNQVAFDTHKTEQMLERVGDRLTPAERQRIVADIAALRRLAETSGDLDELHRALDAFGRSTLRLAEIGISEALKQ